MTDAFLTAADLLYLTGYVQAKRQDRWLTQRGIAHHLSRDGAVRVTWTQVNFQGGQPERTRPNIEAARG